MSNTGKLMNSVAADLREESNAIGTDTTVRPPIGVRPRYLCDEERLKEICGAVHYYLESMKDPPLEWLEELQEILTRDIEYRKNLLKEPETTTEKIV